MLLRFNLMSWASWRTRGWKVCWKVGELCCYLISCTRTVSVVIFFERVPRVSRATASNQWSLNDTAEEVSENSIWNIVSREAYISMAQGTVSLRGDKATR